MQITVAAHAHRQSFLSAWAGFRCTTRATPFHPAARPFVRLSLVGGMANRGKVGCPCLRVFGPFSSSPAVFCVSARFSWLRAGLAFLESDCRRRVELVAARNEAQSPSGSGWRGGTYYRVTAIAELERRGFALQALWHASSEEPHPHCGQRGGSWSSRGGVGAVERSASARLCAMRPQRGLVVTAVAVECTQ